MSIGLIWNVCEHQLHISKGVDSKYSQQICMMFHESEHMSTFHWPCYPVCRHFLKHLAGYTHVKNRFLPEVAQGIIELVRHWRRFFSLVTFVMCAQREQRPITTFRQPPCHGAAAAALPSARPRPASRQDNTASAGHEHRATAPRAILAKPIAARSLKFLWLECQGEHPAEPPAAPTPRNACARRDSCAYSMGKLSVATSPRWIRPPVHRPSWRPRCYRSSCGVTDLCRKPSHGCIHTQMNVPFAICGAPGQARPEPWSRRGLTWD